MVKRQALFNLLLCASNERFVAFGIVLRRRLEPPLDGHEVPDVDLRCRRIQHEWRLAHLAQELKIPSSKLRDWATRGWLQGRQTSPEGPWIVWADNEEIKRLKKLREQSTRGAHAHPKELTTPKKHKGR